MNSREKFSVLLIPHQMGRIREIKLSPHVLVLVLVGVGLLLGSSLFFSLSAASRVSDKLKLSRLEKENPQVAPGVSQLAA